MTIFPQESGTLPTVLLLATYHLANNNLDVFNVQFDDMLSPRRQQEIAQCVEQLQRFQPTKVAVERLSETADDLNKEYRRYRAGTFALTANEIHQLGFRTAAALGHEQVYAIDWKGDMEWDPAYTFAQEHQPTLLNQMLAPLEHDIEEMNSMVRQLSVNEILRRTNDPVSLARNHRTYLTMMRIGEEQQYIGVEAVKNWYARNMRIFVNLTRIINSPQDRILVIYGAGHIPLLSQYVRDSGLYVLEEAATYLQIEDQ